MMRRGSLWPRRTGWMTTPTRAAGAASTAPGQMDRWDRPATLTEPSRYNDSWAAGAASTATGQMGRWDPPATPTEPSR